ncbi:DUF1800 domain-containing protein [Aeromicrobium duanguangcaii]|uniref:DUF1800 domain-containing protein n=1 Tax=Aeromicrobium duanguangcaii TaxID=2968086 RepID=UPI002016AC2F|nr:DUF1800 domain-containing protein [Aeromicrobium duanguangcaii]MCL3837820.1 DUF1800 domain-containing protein [Aeromicrobium duanguangcaii]
MPAVPGTQPRLSETAQHLVRRFTYGYNRRLEADVLRHTSLDAWLETQVKAGPDPDADAVLNWFPRLKDSPDTAWENNKAERYGGWQYGDDLVKYSLARRVVATNQVHEMMVDFWSNLLHIPVGEGSSFPWRMHYDTHAIRPHALGTYRALLRAAVTHPAMSGYLSNHRNTKTQINENLGRELLELYTVGRTAGYTEDDVKGSARLLTGFTVGVNKDFAAGYDPAKHHVGPVTVMGRTFTNAAADGRAELNAYLDWLAMRPETAARIARRLCVRFIRDDPPQSSVDAVTGTYLSSGSDISACLRTLVRDPGFLASKFQKARTPAEDVLATQRACDIVPTGAGPDSHVNSFSWLCSWIGQAPFQWPRPDGSPEQSDTYLSPARLLRGWTARSWMANANGEVKKGTRPLPRDLVPPVWPLALEDLVHHQAVMMTGRRATTETVNGVATLMAKAPSHVFKAEWERNEGHMTWMLTLVRTAILSAPEAMLR